MVNLDMSGENLAEVQHNVETPNKVVVGTSIPRKIPGRVDINNLMSKVREEEKAKKRKRCTFWFHQRSNSCYWNNSFSIIF